MKGKGVMAVKMIDKNCISNELMQKWLSGKVPSYVDGAILLHLIACEKCFKQAEKMERKIKRTAIDRRRTDG